jgi:protein disulfide-isomerase A6
MMRGLLLIASAVAASASGAVEMTHSNFAELTKGKNAFVKFVSGGEDKNVVSSIVATLPCCSPVLIPYFNLSSQFASWCGHCKSMKPAWDQLGDEYAASSSVLIGDAECTDSAEELCEQFEIRGYPTIKYFLDGDTKGEDYQGGRDFDSLKKFVEETLEVKCDVNDPTECSDKEKAYIEKMKAKSKGDRVKQITRLEGMAGESMKAELKAWLNQRLHILRSLDK